MAGIYAVLLIGFAVAFVAGDPAATPAFTLVVLAFKLGADLRSHQREHARAAGARP